MRRARLSAAAAVVAAAALAGSAGPALAECVSQTNRFPDYADVAPTARTVVIGTVVETRPDDDRSAGRFSLRVDHVIRGDPPAIMDVEFLRSGLPRRGSPACRDSAYLRARTGDVIALALDGRLDGRGGVNTAAWIEGRPSVWDPGIRVMSSRQAIRAAKDLPATDAVPATEPPPPRVIDHGALLVLLGVMTSGAALVLRSRRRREG